MTSQVSRPAASIRARCHAGDLVAHRLDGEALSCFLHADNSGLRHWWTFRSVLKIGAAGLRRQIRHRQGDHARLRTSCFVWRANITVTVQRVDELLV